MAARQSHAPVAPLILQSVNAECGLACVAMVAAAHGRREDLVHMEQRTGAGVRGVTLTTLRRIAFETGLDSRVVVLTAVTLDRLKLPAIAHWDDRHFVVIAKVKRSAILVNDPATGRRWIARTSIGARLSGIAVELTPSSRFERGDFRQSGVLRRLIGPSLPSAGRWGTLVMLMALTQGAALLIPLSFQVGIDRLLPLGDANLIVQAYLALFCVVLLDALLKNVRERFIAWLGNTVRMGLSASLLTRCLRLPLGFFEGRSSHDTASKYESLSDIQRVLIEDSPKALVDLSLALSTGILLLVWQPQLAAVSFVAAALYGVIVAVSMGVGVETANQAFLARCSERAHVLESIQIVRTIKSFNLITPRMQEWRRVMGGAMTAETALALHRRRLAILRETILNAEVLASGALICLLLLNAKISLGGVVAVMVYKRFFIGGAFGAIDFVPRIPGIARNAERLRDILVSEPEADLTPSAPPGPLALPVKCFEVHRLQYTYAGAASPAFSGLRFQARSGQMIALAGPSGCGKTTAIKVMLGLLPIQSGDVTCDGQPITAMKADWRSRTAAVFQDDILIAGTIATNIALSNELADKAALEQAARLACIHDDICELPLGYDTPISDGALPMSRGQIQRILIARAVFRQPTVLFLDEGTANLDGATEAEVLANLRAPGRLVIHVAHRATVLQSCDQVIHFGIEPNLSFSTLDRSRQHA